MTTLAPLQMGTLLHALPPQPQGFAAVNDDEFPALGTERKVARTVQHQAPSYRQAPVLTPVDQRKADAKAERELKNGRQVGTVVTIKQNYAFVRPLSQTDDSEHLDVFLHATDMRPGETWVDLWDRVSYSVASYKDRTKCVDARRLEDAKGPDLDDVLSGEPPPRPPRRPASPNRRGRRGGEQNRRQQPSAPVTGNTMTPEQHQQLMYYYAYQQQYPYPYVQPVAYDPTQYAYGYAYPQNYYVPGNPGFPQPLAPIDRESAEALAEASAAAAAAKGADDDAAPGEPEEGTPKLKPRADTFDGPAL